MAQLGIARFEDLVGRVDLLRADDAIGRWRERGVDLTNVLRSPDVPSGTPLRRSEAQASPLPGALDYRLIEAAEPALARGERVTATFDVSNVDRTIGGLLSHEVTRRHGRGGLPAGAIRVRLFGSAGQSFGAWLAPGIELQLVGDANDYVGKGLSGGTLSIRPPEGSGFAAETNVIAGNTLLYGATSGRAFIRGLVGERFAVRNSGADAVVEGVGDHGCEYMTGGRVVVIGPTGRNFAAGMSGGIAYVLDEDDRFAARCNTQLVGLEKLDKSDEDTVRALLAEHLERTGSPVAARLLADWRPQSFVKVFPHDFKRALEEFSAGGVGFLTQETEGAPV
jgi:glutamate synthase (NADPH/NADH) large chain/glutamate synthase (ferredoxin)